MAKNLVDGTATKIEQSGNNISVRINFPIGYIYMSTSSTNPSTYFGGTWQRIAKGRTLVGVDENDSDFDTASETGGEKTHTLTVNEMPNHSHSMDGWVGSGAGAYYAGTVNNTGTKYEDSLATKPTGGGQAHNNMQPYFTCYIWEKVGN